MTEQPTACVIYAAKSTQDKHGSIPAQVEDCKRRAEREGWEVVGIFTDEAFSAYSGNRGPGLEDAKALAAQTASERGRCILVAQDADRFARGAGDAPGAADHLGEVYFAMKRQGVELWTDRSGQLDPLRAVMEGERSTGESQRKSGNVSDGLKRRRDERGQPVGPIPTGYCVEQQAIDGKVITRRVVDPDTAWIVERIFDRVEAGDTFGEIARALNDEGVPTKRGGVWSGRRVNELVANPVFTGATGYPPIITAERWEAIQGSRRRLDPTAIQSRKGGRRPIDDSYLLRGVAFCLSCGATLYTRRLAIGRVYQCSNVRTATGLCSAPAIPAVLIERHVLTHLHVFIGSVEDWIAERVQERGTEQAQREAAVDRERTRLADLDRDRERHLAEYRKLVAEGKSVARIALEEVERIDRERAAQQRVIEKASAVVSEWAGPPDTDAALDFYTRIVDLVEGRVRAARGARELNQALRQVIAGLWAKVDDQKLVAEFALLAPEPGDDKLNGLVQAMWPDVEGRRVAFPSVVNPTAADLVKASLAADPTGRRITLDGPVKPAASPRSSRT